jgi:hypothetical protein
MPSCYRSRAFCLYEARSQDKMVAWVGVMRDSRRQIVAKPGKENSSLLITRAILLLLFLACPAYAEPRTLSSDHIPTAVQHTVTIGTEITQMLRPSTEKSSASLSMKFGQTFFTSTTTLPVLAGTLNLYKPFVSTCVIRSQPRSLERWALLTWIRGCRR